MQSITRRNGGETFQIVNKSYAKVNLILSLGPQGPEGRYSTDFIMQEIDLSDNIRVSLTDSPGVQVQMGPSPIACDESNSCVKAYKCLENMNRTGSGVLIDIDKRIPARAGLGGGSSNAACTANELNRLWNLNLSPAQIIELINEELGTDASFFVQGDCARVRDNGLTVSPIDKAQELSFLLIMPEVEAPPEKTAEVYKTFDLKKVSAPPRINAMTTSLEEGDVKGVAKAMYNAFEFCLPDFYKDIPTAKQDLIECGALNAIMCGAGPTVVGLFRDRASAKQALQSLEHKYSKVCTANSLTRSKS